jgi:hypothetical protein
MELDSSLQSRRDDFHLRQRAQSFFPLIESKRHARMPNSSAVIAAIYLRHALGRGAPQVVIGTPSWRALRPVFALADFREHLPSGLAREPDRLCHLGHIRAQERVCRLLLAET